VTSLKTAQQELRDRRSWLALEYKRTTDALEALDALSNEAAASRVKP
jgi:hypothetical protein